MASQMNIKATFTPVINNSLIQAQGAASGAIYANSFKSAFSKVQPLGRITGSVSEFEKSMEASNARVIAFGASAGSIYLVKVAIDKLISSTINVQKSLTSINVILGLGNTALKAFSNEMFRAASASGQTFETASKVALEFARHGVSASETAKRMTSAMQLMRISGLDAADSVNVITSAINAFNREGLTSADIVNRLTAVDTKFAISAQDLSKAIQRVGSTAEDAGVHFNQLLGLVTAAQTATARGGAVIGNAFKSIFTRLTRPQVLDDLQAIGITVKNQSGQILPMITILKNLAASYNTLNVTQKSFITEAVGGVYQVNILKAALADLGNGVSIFDKASLAASESTGLIESRMNQLNETISSKLNTSVNELTKLFSSFGQIAFADKAQKGVQSFNEQIQFLSKSLEDISSNDSIGEKIQKTIGSGIAQGLGSLISGPGIQVAVVLIAKSFSTLYGFIKGITKDFLGMNASLQRQETLLASASNFLAKNVDLIERAATGQITMNQLTAAWVREVEQAGHALAVVSNLQASMSKIGGPLLSVTPHTPFSGYIPNFSEADAEREGAKGHGYLAGATYKKNIFDGKGNSFLSMVNQAEHVIDFTNSAGFKSTMVIPPNGFGGDTMRAAGGFTPNFALDKVFSIAMKKSKVENRGDSRSHGGKILSEHGLEFEKIILQRAADYGFVSMKSLSKIMDNPSIESDFYAERSGIPWLLDAKYSPGGESTKVSQLAEKERTMKSFWEKAQNNPEILSKIDPRLLQEEFKKKIQFGVITTPVLSSTRERSLEKEGIEHEYLKVFGGFAPNFAKETLWRGVGGKRIAQFRYNMNEEFREITPEHIHNIIFNPPNPSEDFQDILNDAFHSKSGVNIGAIQYLLQRHTHESVGGVGGKIHSGLLSTSRDRAYAKDYFAQKNVENLGSLDLQSSRIFTPAKLEKLLKRVGPVRLSKMLAGPREKFVGFDVNAFLGLDSKIPEEKEVALYSKGFIPNFNSIQDAIGREMNAGYSSSQIRIGSDRSLRSSNNPQGLGIYNTTEGSLSNGIGLAQSVGINPKTKGMAGGFVPNFDLQSTFALGVLQASMGGLSQKINVLSIGYDKEITQKQRAYEAFDKMISEINAMPGGPIKKFVDKYKTTQEFIKEYKFDPSNIKMRESHQKRNEAYESQIKQTQERISGIGFKTMIGAPFIGEMTSSILQTVGKPDQAKAVSTLTEGVTEAAQALFALPNAAGVAVGGILLFSKAGDAINQWTSKEGQAAKALDTQKTFLEKSVSALSTLQNSYDSLNSMFVSGQTDLQSFLNITKHISESMTELASVSPDLARKFSLAGTPEERQKIASQFVDEQSLKTRQTDFNATFQKMITDQKVFGIDVYKNSSEGQFSAGTKEEAINKDTIKTSAAILIQSQVLEALSKSSNPSENQIVKHLAQGEGTTTDLNAIITNLNKSSTFQGLGGGEQNAIKQKLTDILGQIVIPPDKLEAFKKNRDELQLQQRIELETRKRYNQELQSLIAKGTILSNFNNQGYSQSLQQQSSRLGVQYSQAAGQLKLESLFTSESAIVAKRGSLEQQRILAETPLKQQARTAQGAEEIGKLISNEIKTLFPEPEKAVGQEAYGRGMLNKSQFLSQRQALFSGENSTNLFALSQKTPEEFTKGFLGPKPGNIDEGSYKELSATIQRLAASPAFQENTGNTLLSLEKIAQEAADESQKQNDEMITAIKEIDFKELADSLGGLKLLGKGNAREMHRRIIHDEYLEQHGRTAESRGRGAVDLLQLIPEGQRDRNNPYIQRLLNEGVVGMQSAGDRALRNTNLGTQGLFGTGQSGAEARIYGNIRTYDSREGTGISSRARELGLDITGGVPSRVSPIDVSPLTIAVNKASDDLDLFANKLINIGNNLPQLASHVAAAEAQSKKTIDTMGTNNPHKPLAGPNPIDPMIQARKWSGNAISISEAAIGSAAVAAGRNIYKTGSLSKGLEKSLPARNFRFRIGGKDMSKEAIDIESHMRAIAEEEKEGDFTTANMTRNALRSKYSREEAVKIVGEKRAFDITNILNKDKMIMPKGATPEAAPLGEEFPVPKSWRGTGGKFTSPNVSKYTTEEIEALTKVGKLGKFAQYGGAISKGLGALNVGFGAYTSYKDYKAGNKWSAAEDIGETALAFTPARPLLAPIDIGKISYQTYKMAHATHQAQNAMNNQRLQEQSIRTNMPELYQVRRTGNREAINEYINNSAGAPPTAQISPAHEEPFKELVAAISEQKSNLKVEDGNLTIKLDLTQASQQIKQMVSVAVADAISGNTRPSQVRQVA